MCGCGATAAAMCRMGRPPSERFAARRPGRGTARRHRAALSFLALSSAFDASTGHILVPSGRFPAFRPYDGDAITFDAGALPLAAEDRPVGSVGRFTARGTRARGPDKPIRVSAHGEEISKRSVAGSRQPGL
jgi:hypothetical protein